MTECFVIVSGEYSDFTIHCVFEREENAIAYAKAYNKNAIKRIHDRDIASDYTPPNAHLKCVGGVSRCPAHGYYYRVGEWELGVERLGFHPAGEVPIGEHGHDPE